MLEPLWGPSPKWTGGGRGRTRIRSRASFGTAGVELSARTLVSQHGVPKSGLWKGFSGAPTAAKAAVGYFSSPPVQAPFRASGYPGGGKEVEALEKHPSFPRPKVGQGGLAAASPGLDMRGCCA